MSLTASFARPRTRRALVLGASFATVGALVLSGCSSDDSAAPEGSQAPAGDLTLSIGTALPQTGTLAFLGPPENAGVEYAISEIEAAGTDLTVEYFPGDSGDTTNAAYETEIPRLLGEDVDLIVGAASSGVSLQFIDEVVGAGVVQFSPANTSAEFTDYDDNGLYWRTAPSDVLQGAVLGNTIARDGRQTLGLIVLNDSYGTGLAGYITEAFEGAGGEVVAESLFNSGDTNFDAQIAEVTAADPDAIVVITFDEVNTILPALVNQYPGQDLYFVDGNLSDFSDLGLAPGAIAGAKGSLPGLSLDTITDFTSEVNDFWVAEGNEPLTEFSYAAESYDAVILSALAALNGGSADSETIAANLQEVSGGSGEGTKCTTFAECAELIANGETIDYDGISGPITFDDNGDPTEASIGIYEYRDDATYGPVE